MAKTKKKVCIVNRLLRLRQVDNPGYQIQDFLKAVGITRSCLHEHFKNPDLNWLPEHAEKIEKYLNIKLENIKVKKGKEKPIDTRAEVNQGE